MYWWCVCVCGYCFRDSSIAKSMGCASFSFPVLWCLNLRIWSSLRSAWATMETRWIPPTSLSCQPHSTVQWYMTVIARVKQKVKQPVCTLGAPKGISSWNIAKHPRLLSFGRVSLKITCSYGPLPQAAKCENDRHGHIWSLVHISHMITTHDNDGVQESEVTCQTLHS